MHRLRQGPRRHPVATSAFLALWLATWMVTVLTWERDAAGYSIGMALGAIPLHLLLPILLGLVVGLYSAGSPSAYAKTCALAGVAFGFVQFGILSVVDMVWLPAVESGPPLRDLVAGTLVSAIAYAGLCAVLGVLGGGLRAGLSALLHHRGEA